MGNNLSSQEESFLEVLLFNPIGLHPTIEGVASGGETNRNNDSIRRSGSGLVGGSAAVADYINEGLMSCSGLSGDSQQSNATSFKRKTNATVFGDDNIDGDYGSSFALASDNARLEGIPAIARCDLPLPVNVISAILRAENENTPVYNIEPQGGRYYYPHSDDSHVRPDYPIIGCVKGERLKGFMHHVWCLLDQAVSVAASEAGTVRGTGSNGAGSSNGIYNSNGNSGSRRGSPLPCGLAFVRVIMRTIITSSCVNGTSFSDDLVKRLWIVKDDTIKNNNNNNAAASESVDKSNIEESVSSLPTARVGSECIEVVGHASNIDNRDEKKVVAKHHSFCSPQQYPFGKQVFTPAPDMLVSRLLHSLCVYITTVPVTTGTIRTHIEAVKLLLTMQSTALHHEAPFSEKSIDVLTEAILHEGSLVSAMTVVLLQRLVRYHRSAMAVVSATALGNVKHYSESAIGATLVSPHPSTSSGQTKGANSFDSLSSTQARNDDGAGHYHPALAFQVAADPTLMTVSASHFDPSSSAERHLDEQQLTGSNRGPSQPNTQTHAGGLLSFWRSSLPQPSSCSTQNNITPKYIQRHLKPQLHVIVRRHVSASFLLMQLSLQLLVSTVYHQKGNGVNPAMDTIRQLTDGGNDSDQYGDNLSGDSSTARGATEGQDQRIYRMLTINHGLHFKEISEVFATWLCSPAFPELSLLLYAFIVENPTYLHLMLTKHMVGGGVLESLFLAVLALLNSSSHPVEEPPSMHNEGGDEGEYINDELSSADSTNIDRQTSYTVRGDNNYADSLYYSTEQHGVSGWFSWFTGIGGDKGGVSSDNQKNVTSSPIPPGSQRDSGRNPFVAHNSATKLTYCFKFHMCSTLILILSQELVINNALFTTWKGTQVRFAMDQAHKNTQQLERRSFTGLPPIRVLASNNSSHCYSSVDDSKSTPTPTVTVSKNTYHSSNGFSGLDASHDILASLVPYCGHNWSWTNGLLETYYSPETTSLNGNATSSSGGGPTCGSVYIMTVCRCIARALSLRYLEGANMLIGALQNVSPFVHHLDPATSQKLTNLLSVAMRRLSRISTAEAAEMLWRKERQKNKREISKGNNAHSLYNSNNTSLPNDLKDHVETKPSHRNGAATTHTMSDNHVDGGLSHNTSKISPLQSISQLTSPSIVRSVTNINKRHMFHNTVVYTPSVTVDGCRSSHVESLAGYWLKHRRHFQHLYHFIAPNEAFLMYANEFDSIEYDVDKYNKDGDDDHEKRMEHVGVLDPGLGNGEESLNMSVKSAVLEDINYRVREEFELAVRIREQEVESLVGVVVGVAEAIVGAISASDRHNDALMYELLYNKPQLRIFPQLMSVWEQFQQPCYTKNINNSEDDHVLQASIVSKIEPHPSDNGDATNTIITPTRHIPYLRLPIDYAPLVTEKDLSKTTERFRYIILEALEPIHDIISHVESELALMSVHHTPDNILSIIKSVVEAQKSVRRKSVYQFGSERCDDIGYEVYDVGHDVRGTSMNSTVVYNDDVSSNTCLDSTSCDLEGSYSIPVAHSSSDIITTPGHRRAQLLPLPNCLELVCVYRESDGSVAFFTPFVWALITSGAGGVGVGSVPMGHPFWHRDPYSDFKLLSSMGYVR